MLEQLYVLPVLLFSVVIHEISHGYVALRLGDPTAKEMGRLTLNPIPHIDLVGSLLVPLFSLLVAGRVFIAWARPVPVNPLNFSSTRRDSLLVAVVGPLSNIVMALACSLLTIVTSVTAGAVDAQGLPILNEFFSFMTKMFYAGIYLNVVLAVFNLIPIPPLDGSHVVASLLPPEAGVHYRRIGFLGIFVILLLLNTQPFRQIFSLVIEMVASPFIVLIQTFA